MACHPLLFCFMRMFVQLMKSRHHCSDWSLSCLFEGSLVMKRSFFSFLLLFEDLSAQKDPFFLFICSGFCFCYLFHVNSNVDLKIDDVNSSTFANYLLLFREFLGGIFLYYLLWCFVSTSWTSKEPPSPLISEFG